MVGTLFFVVVMTIAAAWLWAHRSDQVEVIALRHPVPAGSVLQRSDLSSERVSGVKGAVVVADLDAVLGKTTRTELVGGQVLDEQMITSQPVPAPGYRLVAVQADATRIPQRIGPGDHVQVLRASPAGDDSSNITTEDNGTDSGGEGPGTGSSSQQAARPDELAARAVVLTVSHVSGGATRLTLQVPRDDAAQVALAAAANSVVVIVTPLDGDG